MECASAKLPNSILHAYSEKWQLMAGHKNKCGVKEHGEGNNMAAHYESLTMHYSVRENIFLGMPSAVIKSVSEIS